MGRGRCERAGVAASVVTAAIVLLLLLWPIGTRAGDHEKQYCGNGFGLDLDAWLGGGPDARYYWEKAWLSCNSQRIDRLAASVAVTALGGVAVTVLIRRRAAG